MSPETWQLWVGERIISFWCTLSPSFGLWCWDPSWRAFDFPGPSKGKGSWAYWNLRIALYQDGFQGSIITKGAPWKWCLKQLPSKVWHGIIMARKTEEKTGPEVYTGNEREKLTLCSLGWIQKNHLLIKRLKYKIQIPILPLSSFHAISPPLPFYCRYLHFLYVCFYQRNGPESRIS